MANLWLFSKFANVFPRQSFPLYDIRVLYIASIAFSTFHFFAVMDHSADNANGTVNDTDCGRVDMTVVLTTIATTTETVTTTESVTQTTTESFTFNHTVTANLYCTPSPSTLQSSGTAGSASCSSRDTDNAPIYVAVAIVIAGLLITITIVIVGVILCRRYQKEKECNRSNGLLTIKDKTAMSVIEVENDLYGEERLQPQSQ